MADLTGRNADETKPDIATWGTGNVLETGEGTVKVDLDGKVAISDIINNLTSEDENKPLSAKQGKQLNDNKASLSLTGSNADGAWLKVYTAEEEGWLIQATEPSSIFTTSDTTETDGIFRSPSIIMDWPIDFDTIFTAHTHVIADSMPGQVILWKGVRSTTPFDEFEVNGALASVTSNSQGRLVALGIGTFNDSEE